MGIFPQKRSPPGPSNPIVTNRISTKNPQLELPNSMRQQNSRHLGRCCRGAFERFQLPILPLELLVFCWEMTITSSSKSLLHITSSHHFVKSVRQAVREVDDVHGLYQQQIGRKSQDGNTILLDFGRKVLKSEGSEIFEDFHSRTQTSNEKDHGPHAYACVFAKSDGKLWISSC